MKKNTFKLKWNDYVLKTGIYWKLPHKSYIYTWILKEKENFKILNLLLYILIVIHSWKVINARNYDRFKMTK